MKSRSILFIDHHIFLQKFKQMDAAKTTKKVANILYFNERRQNQKWQHYEIQAPLFNFIRQIKKFTSSLRNNYSKI